MSECLIVGGGVIGLSLAYELAGHGMRVRVIDSGQPGREASWAGAGILPPAADGVDDPLEQLTALSNRLHATWSAQLRETTQVDNGFRRSGGIYLARDERLAAELAHFAARAGQHGIDAERLSSAALAELEPALRPSGQLAAAYLVPSECQIRNPRHLKALVAGCRLRGVEIDGGTPAEDFEIRGARVRAVRTAAGWLAADNVCVAGGAWSGGLVRRLGVAAEDVPAIRPIRGQIVLLALERMLVSRIVNEGSRYLVPRTDGRLLVGSTEEDAGFDRRTTAEATAGLLEFAFSLAPQLKQAQIERTWAGLRPATRDGLPYLGRVEHLDNAFVAAGHFRGGLQLSTGTAVVVGQLIRGQPPKIDLTPFQIRARGDANGQNAAEVARRARRELSSH